MPALITIRFDGTLCVEEHSVTLRTLSKALVGIQGAVDRAYIDERFGHVYKHARLPYDGYDETDFIVGEPRDGSFILDFSSLTADVAAAIIRRIKAALRDPYAQARNGGLNDVNSITRQIESRQIQIANSLVQIREINQLNLQNDPLAVRTYGDKSIAKEIDQMLAMVRRDEGAAFDITLKADDLDEPLLFSFNQQIAKNFSKVIKQRQLGSPVVCTGIVRELDHGHNQRINFKGKFINSDNGKTVIIHIDNDERFSMLRPYLGGEEIRIIACPIIEYHSYDPVAGDIQFISMLD